MQAGGLAGGHLRRSQRIGRRIAGDAADLLLRLGLDHVFQELMRQILIVAGGGDHQVIDPAGGVLFRYGFGDGEIQLAELIGHEWPSHGRHHFVVLK